MICTWKECSEEGQHVHVDLEGAAWAELCPAHHAKLEEALKGLKPPHLVAAWALAGHGHPARQAFLKGAAQGMGALAALLSRKKR